MAEAPALSLTAQRGGGFCHSARLWASV